MGSVLSSFISPVAKQRPYQNSSSLFLKRTNQRGSHAKGAFCFYPLHGVGFFSENKRRIVSKLTKYGQNERTYPTEASKKAYHKKVWIKMAAVWWLFLVFLRLRSLATQPSQLANSVIDVSRKQTGLCPVFYLFKALLKLVSGLFQKY